MTAPAHAEEALEPTSEVISILEEFLTKLEAGARLSPADLAGRCPELAEPLKACLASLEFLHDAGVSLRDSVHPGLPAVTECPSEPRRVGDFQLVREIGRGGMGVVYEAEQVSLGRRVALKVLPFAAALDARQLQRFKNEAQAAACLHHTNIVPIFGVGCECGVHYYAMQYIEGQTLAAIIRNLRCGKVCGLPGLMAEPSDGHAAATDAGRRGSCRRCRTRPRGGAIGHAGRPCAGTCSSTRRCTSGYQAGQPARRSGLCLQRGSKQNRGERRALMGHRLRPGALPPGTTRADCHWRPRGHAART